VPYLPKFRYLAVKLHNSPQFPTFLHNFFNEKFSTGVLKSYSTENEGTLKKRFWWGKIILSPFGSAGVHPVR
jgi:hypothetical protein